MFEYLKYFWKNSANEFNIILYFIFLLNVICFLINIIGLFFFGVKFSNIQRSRKLIKI